MPIIWSRSNNVLEMARIEKGTIVLDEMPLEVEKFANNVFSVFQELMDEKEIKYTMHLNNKTKYVYCDATKTNAVFINILSNANKYTGVGGSVHFQLDELPSEKEGWTVFRTTISDTGIGMSEDFLPHIFEEFSREQNTTHNKIEGTGLGMPIVKRLVEFMKGTIEVKSKKGVGTTFIVTFPLRIAQNAADHQPGVVEVKPEQFKGKRILLAEDNEINAEIAKAILGEVGFDIDCAEDGNICVNMLAEAPAHTYDVILMDLSNIVEDVFRMLEASDMVIVPGLEDEISLTRLKSFREYIANTDYDISFDNIYELNMEETDLKHFSDNRDLMEIMKELEERLR